jgi:hypothetical protein
MPIRFEQLMSEERSAVIQRMAEFYARRCDVQIEVDACAAQMSSGIAPKKSHTFRTGKKANWANEFTLKHRQLFNQHAGALLTELGYETDQSWAETTEPSEV